MTHKRLILNIYDGATDRKGNICIRKKTELCDVVEQMAKLKWTWAEDIARKRGEKKEKYMDKTSAGIVAT